MKTIEGLEQDNLILEQQHKNLKLWNERQKKVIENLHSTIERLEMKKEPIFNVVLFTSS